MYGNTLTSSAPQEKKLCRVLFALPSFPHHPYVLSSMKNQE